MVEVSSREQVSEDIRMLSSLIGLPARKLKQQYADDNVCLAVRRIISAESSLRSGEVVCRILRLPMPWRQTLLECLNGSEPYTASENRPDGEVTIRNDGPDLSYVARLKKRVPYNQASGEPEPERTTHHDDRRVWPAGETKTLPLSTAIRLLQDHSLQAVQPVAMDQECLRPDVLNLREIGYRIRMYDPDAGEMITYQSEERAEA